MGSLATGYFLIPTVIIRTLTIEMRKLHGKQVFIQQLALR